ncbi:Hemocytin, partial [Stegodyphus mimosarum]
MEVKYIKIIPETWHRWPSFRLDIRGCHIYPEVTAVPELVPSLCPELLNEPDLTTNCPSACPDGLLCNGEECVDPVDCSCVIDGKIFQVSDRVEDHACRQCDCALGGRSVCADKKCPPCKEDERSSLGTNCECKCEKCSDDEVLCPTSHECIPKKRWCDDIVDCPDDETNCPITTEIPVTPVG